VRIAILGPGGVGGLLAAALARAGQDVTVVARSETAALIADRGIEVSSVLLGDFTAQMDALERLNLPVEALIVATKATGLEAALERIEAVPPLAVPLLNGLGHLELLRARFGSDRVAAGTIRVESDRPAPARIVQTSPFLRIELASARSELHPRLERLAAALSAASVPTTVQESEAQVLWSKIVRLNALALTTSAADRPLGEIRDDPRWRSALEQAVAETAAVAAAEGARIDPAATMAELEEAHPGLGSSMQRDNAAGRTPELDAIAGSVLRAARRHGSPCPAVSWLSTRVAERAGLAAPAV
jgi:2-dehydropantoate 2-reductase